MRIAQSKAPHVVYLGPSSVRATVGDAFKRRRHNSDAADVVIMEERLVLFPEALIDTQVRCACVVTVDFDCAVIVQHSGSGGVWIKLHQLNGIRIQAARRNLVIRKSIPNVASPGRRQSGYRVDLARRYGTSRCGIEYLAILERPAQKIGATERSRSTEQVLEIRKSAAALCSGGHRHARVG